MEQSITIELAQNGYLYIKKLGRGGFGEVYLVKEAISGNLFAAKRLNVSDQNKQQDILREIRSLGMLNHPHIVSYKTAFRANGRLYLIMEYCEGGDLKDYITAQQLSGERLMELFIELTSVYGFIHQNGIIHQDIKPQNILITKDGVPKISDFGAINTSIGTTIYCPPEKLAGPFDVTDQRSDIYTLGITLLELLKHEHPFINQNKNEILDRVKRADFPVEGLEYWLQQVLLRALSFQADDRFQSMHEFGEALQNRRIPKFVNGEMLRMEQIAAKLNQHIHFRRWESARKLASYDDAMSPNLNYKIARGKYFLAVNELDKAQMAFEAAVTINRSAAVEKELAAIYLRQGAFARSHALLASFINKHFFDAEAHNLMLENYFRSGKWELGLEQAGLILKLFPKESIFENNFGLFHGLNHYCWPENEQLSLKNPFIKYNISVLSEKGKVSWYKDKKPHLSSKLLFQDYAFRHLSPQKNTLVFDFKGHAFTSNEAIVSFGRQGYDNTFSVFAGNAVSRRHFVIINQPRNLWLIDLDGFDGVTVDGKLVKTKTFLNGKHSIRFGNHTIELKTNENMLL